MRSIILAVATAFLASAAPAHAQSVSIKDPAAFWAMVKALGYAPAPLEKADTAPQFDIDLHGLRTRLFLRGCTAGKDCKYITLVGSYADIVNAPPQWVRQLSDEFDLLRVGTGPNGQLYMFSGFVVEGLPQSELQHIFDYWVADTRSVAKAAIEQGYATKK